MKLSLSHIKYFFILLPFLLVFVAEIISFRNQPLGAILKFSAVFYMFLYSLTHLKFDFKTAFFFILFLPFFIFHIYISFNLYAALEEAIRYLFPFIVLIYGFSIRKHYKVIIYFIIGFAILNNLYQPIVYFNWARDVQEQWFYYRVNNSDSYYYNETMGVIRGVGLMGFFASYGFLNLIAFFLTRQYYFGKYKKLVLALFILGVLSSLSFKAIGVFVLLMLLLSKRKTKILIGIVGSLLLFIAFFPKKALDFSNQLLLRIQIYITEGNSARTESYRVMFKDFVDLRLVGRGVGSFGGASSTKYDSPVYDDVNFNWYETPYLATTDTFFPHIFVEMGIIGGMLYFLILLSPVMRRNYKKRALLMLFVVYFALFFDSLFSFALNNMGYLMVSLILVYPILEYEKNIVNWKRTK